MLNGVELNGERLELKIPKNRELLGGDLVAQSLYALGVRHAFGLHGGHLDAFLMGSSDIGIELIDTRHETVGVQAAEGYAKVAGKCGTCFFTANSGYSNALPGLASAYADRSPIFCVTSSPPLRDAETNCLQGFHDQVVVAKPLTKFAHRVTNAEEIPRLVAHAWRTAISAPPGPVLLDFPIDILFSPIPDMNRIAWGAIDRPLPFPPAPDGRSIQIAVKLIKEAKRPCLISGTGGKGKAIGQCLFHLCELTNMPIFNSHKYSSALPLDHPCRCGPANNLALLAAKGKEQPDLVILLGARTGFLLGSRTGAILPNKDCKFIQIDVDGSEIGRSHSIDVGIVSDSCLALSALNAELEKAEVEKGPSEWLKLASSLKNTKSAHADEPEEMSPRRPHPYHAVKKFLQSLEPGSIVVKDGGEAGCWMQDLVETTARTSQYLDSCGYLGFLGNGWGYSLGAAIAEPSKQIINFQGDGSAGFHCQEFDTYARLGVNILTVVVNNYCWGMSKSGQELIYGNGNSARPATRLSDVTRYDKVAEAFGCRGAKVDKLEDIEAAVKELSDGPSCLNLIVSDKPMHDMTIAMVDAVDDPNVIVVPYYDNVPRPFYKN